jgi:hypothetical protein
MKKLNLKEIKGALTRKEMKNIIAGGSLRFFPAGSCCITFNSSCNGRPAGSKMCINLQTEPSVQGCNYLTNGCTGSNNYCGGMSCGSA